MSKQALIELMLKHGVLRFGEFTLKSGRLSPYFVNTGLYKTGGALSELGHLYAQKIIEVTGGTFDCMFGTAYKGIPLVSAAAVALYRDFNTDKPYLFNRKEIKTHGEGGILVGYTPSSGERMIIVEDVITAGTALREVMPILRELGVTINDMFISVDRCERVASGKTAVKEVYDEFGIRIHPIVTVHDIIGHIKTHPELNVYADAMQRYVSEFCVN